MWEPSSEREKLLIAANYYGNVTGELDKATQTYQDEIECYPRDFRAYDNLGVVFAQQGQYEKTAEITRRARLLSPDLVALYGDLANYTLALERFDETRQVIHKATQA